MRKEETNFDQWLEEQVTASPNRIDPERQRRMWTHVRQEAGLPHTSEHRPLRLWHNIANVAAILLPVTIALCLYLYLTPTKGERFVVAAEKGEKASVTLPDGSKVTLNSGTTMAYYSDYSRKRRLVELSGEAYFEVTHQPSKPFQVSCAGDVTVTVLGTTFGVEAYPDEPNVSVVLNTGKIKLSTPRQTLFLKPDERVVYNKRSKLAQVENVTASDYTDWRKNRLRFENESLANIIKVLARMHNADIRLDDPQIAHIRYTGTMNNTNIEAALHFLTLTSPLEYQVKDGIIYLSIKKE
ncbi:MAG: FecR domain-containing protein [Mediterranea sp.]|jgi:ferric-dicitrate binding protein FerR (iron transport regulator)|nr:FecR domain-containing protein [Mediterranea sp.]